MSGGEPVLVTIYESDIGFRSNEACGLWTLTGAEPNYIGTL